MEVILGRMEVKGFASIKHIVFNWDMKGLNVIQAPNGSGKSKLISALTWVLYGKTLSGSVTPWLKIQDKDFKGTYGSQFFNINGISYQIIRCRDYSGKVLNARGGNRLIIIEDGEELTHFDKKKGDKQKYIDELLGYSFELFKNSIIFGQKLKKLINETGPNKKKVLDEAFEISYIAKARKIAEERLFKLKSEIGILEPEIKGLKYNIKREEDLLESLKDEQLKKKAYKEKLSISLEGDIKSIKFEINRITKDITNLSSLEKRLSEYDTKVKDIEKETRALSNSLLKEITQLNTSKGISEKFIENKNKALLDLKKSLKHIPSLCPRCNKPFDKHEIKQEEDRIKKDIEIITNEISLEESNLNDTIIGIQNNKKGYTSLDKMLQEVENIIKEKKLLEININNLVEDKEKLPKLEQDLENKKSMLGDLKKDDGQKNITELTQSIADLKTKLLPLSKKIINYSIRKKIYTWAISDPLSNSGIKAFVFDSMLEEINERLTYYSEYVGFNIVFSIDLQGKNKDINTFIIKNNEVIPYDDLSGGQQQAVDIATIFSIHDVVTKNKVCNLLIMDEVFESLDTRNIELVTDLIQDKARDKSIYLVTHRQEFIPNLANIIRIGYENGFSFIY